MSTDTQPHRPDRVEVSLTLNGERVTAEVEPRLKLSDFLRYEAGKRGVRVGCEHGVCGACTVLLDGLAVKSCLAYAVQADGCDVETVEGLADDGGLDPIQRAFHEEHALQCGFCTSGFVLATKELLDREPDPDREEIRAGLADNICRCTGYQNIFDAVERAADYRSEPDRAPEAHDGDAGGDGDGDAGGDGDGDAGGD